MGVLAVLRQTFLAVLLMTAVGCTFHRTVVNAHQADLDTSWIVPGETTFQSIVDRLGLPPMIQGVNGYTSDALHYVAVNTFSGKLEAGWIVTPTFEREHASYTEDLLILFDETAHVRVLSRTRTYRAPVSGKPEVELVEYRTKEE